MFAVDIQTLTFSIFHVFSFLLKNLTCHEKFICSLNARKEKVLFNKFFFVIFLFLNKKKMFCLYNIPVTSQFVYSCFPAFFFSSDIIDV